MTFPATIKILGHVYTIETDVRPQVSNTETIACVDNNRQLIAIATGNGGTTQQECLLHEIIEALNYRMGLDLQHSAITALSEGIYQVLHDAGIWRME
jgi:hypothetical protein